MQIDKKVIHVFVSKSKVRLKVFLSCRDQGFWINLDLYENIKQGVKKWSAIGLIPMLSIKTLES